MKILTFNTALLPEFLNFFNKNYNVKYGNILRTLKIYNMIKNINPDIIFLQEIYDSSILKILFKLFEKDGYKISNINEKNNFVINGIVTISRYEILDSEFVNYNSKGIDVFAFRGMLINKINYDNKIINLINIHLQNLDVSVDINIKQINNIFEYLNKYDNKELFICAGDFNNSLNIDNFHYTKNLVTFDNFNGDKLCIDYIITNIKDFINYESSKTDLSDHYYVLAELEF